MEETADNSVDLATAFGVGVLLIILLLIVNYNSFAKPLVVLLTVPLGAIGALLGLFVTGNALGFMPMLGLVALAGIVVNTGILYIEFADDLIRQRVLERRGVAGPGEKSCNGLTRTAFHEALAEAGRLRVLPISITVGTTVGGLIPLVLFGGPMWEGLAYLMIFGLLVATVLTLVVVPVFYAVLVEWFGVTLVQVDAPGDA
jgi:multidrug efflux pump subunit AcrB